MTFTYEELKSWILSQPPDREIDMDDTRGDGCGCLLIQFARHKNNNLPLRFWAGYTGVTAIDEGTKIECTDRITCEQLVLRADNCQVTKYSEVYHIL